MDASDRLASQMEGMGMDNSATATPERRRDTGEEERRDQRSEGGRSDRN